MSTPCSPRPMSYFSGCFRKLIRAYLRAYSDAMGELAVGPEVPERTGEPAPDDFPGDQLADDRRERDTAVHDREINVRPRRRGAEHGIAVERHRTPADP